MFSERFLINLVFTLLFRLPPVTKSPRIKKADLFSTYVVESLNQE